MDRQETVSTDQDTQFSAEQARITERHRLLGLPTGGKRLALALSGGGIRSATFCLGVVQALARAKAPGARPEANDDGKAGDLGKRLLPRFDYLSTVSGGGYFGSFLGSLFLPGRLRDRENTGVIGAGESAPSNDAKRQAARQAYETLDYEPPGRIHTGGDYRRQPVGAAPLGWLRENGRYLTPGGGGDLFYVLGMSLRNLLAVHMVIGMPLLFGLALAVLLQEVISLSPLCSPIGAFLPLSAAQVVCGSLWWLPIALIVLAILPLMLAYWMVYRRQNDDDSPHPFNLATGLYALAGVAMILLGARAPWIGGDLRVLMVLFGLVCLAGLTYCLLLCRYLGRGRASPDKLLARHNTVATYRVLITRRLATALIFTLASLFFALVPWLSDWLFLRLWQEQGPLISGGALLPLLIALVRWVSVATDDKAKPGWLSKLPISVIAGAAGVLILMLVSLFWGLLVQYVRYTGDWFGDIHAWARLLGLTVLAGLFSLGSGKFIGFLNLSSWQSFYRARLARAYLGASNGLRFSGKTRKQRRRLLSVAETLPGDDVSIEDYYSNTSCAPVHLINVTLNQTVDPAEQLVQRDRKGKPLCLAPSGRYGDASVSYILDGEPRQRATQPPCGEIFQKLSLAHWVATSGAAFSTGLGRATALGTSLAFGLANVRLGTWWPADFLQNGEKDSGLRTPRDTLRERTLTTQHYLFYEITAHFHGLNRDFQYLSDGGHFENTACYELIREGRKIDLIVMCDCGADPTYQFDDLANLIRLARIDQALEISEDPGIFEVEELAPYFGRIQDFKLDSEQRKQADYRRCAILLNVHNKQQQLTSRILLIKPNLIAGLPVDLLNYASEHPTFPNESTANQFFDEAQFEGYRQLGLQIGRRLFGDGKEESKVADALWKYLEY
ncbi:hypothetical protein N7650_06565 [Pseudomonas sp. GD04058]|uniref:hypothetical protein n=1 Tax=Pseudomonas sp. GD04058 TaxID=2975429 RepID=UPI00244A724A|nr:hypothetical protein [Pseudomonas sp. GD04058]MDG9882493.1 hypothetical protein [Pseudomonas sp. GD04058]